MRSVRNDAWLPRFRFGVRGFVEAEVKVVKLAAEVGDGFTVRAMGGDAERHQRERIECGDDGRGDDAAIECERDKDGRK